ncbi:MAG: hypothetical protein GXO69_03070 [Acidobacteria bacterium]|nr:hypothetical protein [Acidobacteriota bacterium]
MKRIITLIVLLILIGGTGFVSYRYLTIRNGSRLYFMKKDTGTFDRVYLDVSGWNIVDYGMHPKISTFLAAKGIRKNEDNWKESIKKKMDAAKKELESLKEKAGKN